jgi:hypothetical protein
MSNDSEIIPYEQAVALHGAEMIEAVLRHGRHHHDDGGRPYWLAAELAEALELVAIEESREEDTSP